MKKHIKISIFLIFFAFAASQSHSWWWSFNNGNSSYTETKYPIVLVHGALGFSSLLGVVDYWYKIPAKLRSGGAEVYVVDVSAVHHPIVRGQQLIEQIEDIRALSGENKVNLIGHSLGAPTIRYAAAVRPEWVASSVSVGGANGESFAPDISQNPILNSLSNIALTIMGKTIDFMSGAGLPQSGEALQDFNNNVEDFNANYPAGQPHTYCGEGDYVVNGVRYYSWTGIRTFTNALDPSDYALVPIGWINPESQNDGPVGRCASHSGKTIRDTYRMNHLDETNLFFGLKDWFQSDIPSVYRQLANRLKNDGV